MTDGICFAGLDVHARKTAAAAVQLGSGEVFKAQLSGSPGAAIEWLQTLPGPVRAVYEAGPTGFGLARAGRAAGIEVMVCSPGAIPRQPGDKIKTDTRDALKLARLHAAGQLRPVVVPALELEALRDLVRAREDLRGDLMSARHRISKLLLRRGLIFDGPGETWSTRHLAWLSRVGFEQPLVEVVFGEYLAHHEVLLARRARLDGLLVEQSVQGPWAPTVARLRCLRGVDTLTAIGLIAEIGDVTAFKHPKQLASYLGLVPSEHSSGTRRRQGQITKAGSTHARRLLIEAAWHYRRPPRVSLTLKRRQAGQPPAAIDAAWRAQMRLHRRWAHLDAARAKKRTTVAVAVARELACFVWEIAHQPD
ncbi:MAG TPA: IS110 family transposase [Solirubrobacteraceae bacterium]|jgi:transposase|nr:IS110 family transposase [Solirubrobacteraceae bacterium]